MKPPYELEADHLAIGLTKPPTKMGVPLIPLFISILSCFFGWMIFQVLSGSTGLVIIIGFVALWCAMYLMMLFMTLNDPFGLSVTWINLAHFRKHKTHTFWGNTDSYAP